MTEDQLERETLAWLKDQGYAQHCGSAISRVVNPAEG